VAGSCASAPSFRNETTVALLQRFADAMLNNDTASPHRLSNFKGFFRGEGRLDAKRLDKQL
jgi:hypothetical protein